MDPANKESNRKDRRLILIPLFFLSGGLALVYQVLWVRELGLLFGNTTYAVATTLAVFFLGLSAGSRFWGRRTRWLRTPLMTYAALEVGIAASALLYFLLLDLYHWIYSPLFAAIGHHPVALLTVKFLLVAGVLFPPSFFMGGTLPVMGECLVGRSDQLGRTGSLLYAVNTLGAALGAFVAGFYLPYFLGLYQSYLMAISGNLVIACAVYLLAPGWAQALAEESSHRVPSSFSPKDYLSREVISLVAFASGFLVLALEVLWTRMFSQVLHNSVYSFSAILTTFLIALALGATLSHILCRINVSPVRALSVLLSLSGVLVGLSPLLFYRLTGGLQYVAAAAGWEAYIWAIFGNTGAVILLPGLVVGSVFPFLLRLAERSGPGVGPIIGRLASINVIGAIAGSLTAGFLLIGWVGLWGGIRLVALIYFILAIRVVYGKTGMSLVLRAVPAAGLVLSVTLYDPGSLPLVRVNPAADEVLLDLWEGSSGTVAVIDRRGDLRMKVNNFYTLGGSASSRHEQGQMHIPLVLHPDPRSVFVLGMGTGITAGAALDHAVERVVICELIPEVIAASQIHFGEFVNGLFDDKRVEMIAEDGRNFLLATPEKFDVIVADLFFPWRRGAGSLWTREHFQNVRAHLNPGGIFAQWLPLYQLSRTEFRIIAGTMAEVFPQVTLWRGDFFTTTPIVALLGGNEPGPLDPEKVVGNTERLGSGRTIPDPRMLQGYPFFFYAGNLTANLDLLGNEGINTDNHPLIEYLTPVTQREEKIGEEAWLTSDGLIDFFNQLARQLPPGEDPYLRDLSPEYLEYVEAGASFYRAAAYRSAGQEREAEIAARDFLARVPAQIAVESRAPEVQN
ncbi:MAG: fused MFS/spermidine synthase [Acidobacteriota bacterium]